MTVIRLPAGEMWIHSPVALTEELAQQIARIGPVGHLVAPNTLHYWWVGEWKTPLPEALVWAVSRLDPGASGRMPPSYALQDEPPAAWGGAIDQVIVEGSRLMEADFFHRPSRTLLITDMIENFEKERVRSRFYRWLFRIGGVIDPDGMTPSDLRPTFAKQRDQLPRRGEADDRVAAEAADHWPTAAGIPAMQWRNCSGRFAGYSDACFGAFFHANRYPLRRKQLTAANQKG